MSARGPGGGGLPMRGLALLMLLHGCAAVETGTGAPPRESWRAICLGAAQDAGFPHLGCFGRCCEEARRSGRREPIAALAIECARGWWLVDATPDLPQQIHAMGTMPRGILLTHAHVGHYAGLMYLGREGMNAQRMPLHCSEKMAEFLRTNAPWDQLVRLGNVEIFPFQSGGEIRLDPAIEVRPLAVPHRNEYADTHAFAIGGLLYVPDADRWEDLPGLAAPFSTLVLDGTFFSGEDLPGRDMSEIPHPCVTDTLRLLEPVAERTVWFTHLNHTNPLWNPGSRASREVSRRGYRVARAGEILFDSSVSVPES